MRVFLLSAIFVLLWSSAFIAAKLAVMDAGPFSFLFIRFVMVSMIFALMAVVLRQSWPKGRQLSWMAMVGVLMHGVYLGGVFFAISRGTSASMAALIVSSHPLVMCLMAVVFLQERISRMQWLGIGCGAIGVILVISPKLGGALPLLGFFSCLAALLGAAGGMILQKRFLGGENLVTGNAVQATAASVFYLVLLGLAEPLRFALTPAFLVALGWSGLVVSLGAFTILLVLIREGRMAQLASLFFMIPGVSAVMGWLAFGEWLGGLGLAGLGLTMAGVWLVNRPDRSGTAAAQAG